MRKMKLFYIKNGICLIGLIIIATLLQGCAATADKMVIGDQMINQGKHTALNNSIEITKVTGGKATNSLWISDIDNDSFKTALEDSLKKVRLYNKGKRAKYQLSAELVELKRPLIGFNMEVKCVVHYKLINALSRKKLYDQTITTVYKATIGDALIAAKRLEIANEGAARKNIEQLIRNLYALPNA